MRLEVTLKFAMIEASYIIQGGGSKCTPSVEQLQGTVEHTGAVSRATPWHAVLLYDLLGLRERVRKHLRCALGGQARDSRGSECAGT